jgi:hypothetical protein
MPLAKLRRHSKVEKYKISYYCGDGRGGREVSHFQNSNALPSLLLSHPSFTPH